MHSTVQVRITQKLALAAVASAAVAAQKAARKGDASANAEDEAEAVREAQALLKRPKRDPETVGDGEDSEDQASPDLPRFISEVGMRLAPLPLPMHGILASSPLYAAALEIAAIQHGAAILKSGKRKFIADSTAPIQAVALTQRNLFVVIYQVRACGAATSHVGRYFLVWCDICRHVDCLFRLMHCYVTLMQDVIELRLQMPIQGYLRP